MKRIQKQIPLFFSIMDIRGFFLTGGKKEGKDDSFDKKRPAEEGASARPPPPKRKFQHSWKSMPG